MEELALTIPYSFPGKQINDLDYHQLIASCTDLHKWQDKGMYAFVCWDWIVPLADFLQGKKVLEVMSGAGYLSCALKYLGIDVIATDDKSWPNYEKFTLMTEIENIDAVSAVEKYGADMDFVIMSWPYMDDTAYFVLKKMHEVNPNLQLIYIGEGYTGCTASDKFFLHYKYITGTEFDEVSLKYDTWWGLHDCPNLGVYSEEEL